MSISASKYLQRNLPLWHKIIRLESAGMPASNIAKIVGCGRAKVLKTLDDPRYKELRDAKISKRISAFDREFAKQQDEMLNQLNELIPLTFQVYERAMTLGLTDPKYIAPAVKAADSVNDRVGIFSRQSTQIHEVKLPQAELDRARELAKQLRTHAIQTLRPISPQLPESSQIIDAEIIDAKSGEDSPKIETPAESVESYANNASTPHNHTDDTRKS